MRLSRISLLAVMWSMMAYSVIAGSEMRTVARKHWFAVHTAHFSIYSCGEAPEVHHLGEMLEQFHDAYSQLAGAQAASSPPVIVMAFPDRKDMEPFLPLYKDKPANMDAFFHHGAEENLIVLSLSNLDPSSLRTIFHEYSHLLFRNNEKVWPLWLCEGMAEIYGMFELAGFEARVGRPIQNHVLVLQQEQWMPLRELFKVGHDSPQYNEGECQSVFYAESWLLTHYLMLGPNPARKASFGQLTVLLRQGQNPEQAFTNAFHCSLKVMEAELHRYLEGGVFHYLAYQLKFDPSRPHATSTRLVPTVEAWFRLGVELMRIGRLGPAEECFAESRKSDPKSPLSSEGMGLLAAAQDRHADAVRELQETLKLNSRSYLAHYSFAVEKYELATGDRHHNRLDKAAASEIRSELENSIKLMPYFAPSEGFLGFIELEQGENFEEAKRHLRKAVQLDPSNYWYVLQLGQAQFMSHDNVGARRTLEMLNLPYVDPGLRRSAQSILQAMNRGAGAPAR